MLDVIKYLWIGVEGVVEEVRRESARCYFDVPLVSRLAGPRWLATLSFVTDVAYNGNRQLTKFRITGLR